ncbi:MAG TPA: hypothetical protein DEP66_01500 [Acidimicrobiaceae bacterium]|nr:hypothetical protein [Acidimicrobiaceae bacterium]
MALSESASIYQLDLLTGSASLVELPDIVDDLVEVDGRIVVRVGRNLMRVDPATGQTVAIADGVQYMVRAYAPPGLVAVSRHPSGVVARVIGTDGVFRSAATLPGAAVVHGALGDHVIATVAGRIVGADGRGGNLRIGTGRVLGVGDRLVVYQRCEVQGCRIVATAFTAIGLSDTRPQRCAEICDRVPGAFGANLDPDVRTQLCEDVCAAFPLVVDDIDERNIALPELLHGFATENWPGPGTVSPDGRRIALRVTQGGGVTIRGAVERPGMPVAGAVVIDLDQGWAQYSPEQGVDLGEPAWSDDGRYLAYPFGDDVMIWDVEAPLGEVRSGRATIGLPLTHLLLTAPPRERTGEGAGIRG